MNNGLKPLRGEASNARRAGMYLQRDEGYDFGVGAPFPSGFTDSIVIGNPQDPTGKAAQVGKPGTGSYEAGYNLIVHGSTAIWDSMSVFSDYQPYIVVGRTNMDNRYPSLRPRGQGEDIALGVSRTQTDYFNNIQPGDGALRVYGPGEGTNKRFRRLHLGSNDGSRETFSDSSVVVGASTVELRRPLDWQGLAMTAGSAALPATPDGYVYILVAGQRAKVPYYLEPVQVSDSFTRADLNRADTGQYWFAAIGSFQLQSNKAKGNSLINGVALALIGQWADSTVSADVTPGGTAHTAWLATRCADGSGSTFLVGSVNSSTGTVDISKKSGSSTYTSLASTSTAAWPLDSTHRLGLKAAGNVITVSIDGSNVLSHTLTGGDIATYGTQQNAGLFTFDTAATYDNFTLTTP